jgi:hypothetical protein
MTQLARKRLDELERTIERGLQTFVNVGNALREIRDEGLYTVEHDTFEKYCRDRWGFEPNYARRLMAGAEVTENLRSVPIGTVLPTTESQARPLTRLDREDQSVAWELAIEKAGDGKVTAAIVEQAVAELSDHPPTTEVHTRKSKDPRIKHLRDACRSIRAARKVSSGFEYSELRVILNSIRKLLKRVEGDEQEEAA